ncbi:MAG: hypothetical protein LBJ65_09360 [Burkholderia sp.]|uniref:hypothetical protein n=1 Tax=Burkholderia sp. TaxID=36773 RepID=UPI0028331D9C|nr:hypothetical protein [Burkholderia sp.]MDR0241794.1 hypothetical protein [Burkholderia sp.]
MSKAPCSFWGFIPGGAKREFRSKCRNFLLGATAIVANPLAAIVVHAVILSRVMHGRLPGVDNRCAHSIHLCKRMLPSGTFVEIVSRARNAFIDHANRIKKPSFPRLCLAVMDRFVGVAWLPATVRSLP